MGKLDLDTLYEVKRRIFEEMASPKERNRVQGMAMAKRVVNDMIAETESKLIMCVAELEDGLKCKQCGRRLATSPTDDGNPEGCTEHDCVDNYDWASLLRDAGPQLRVFGEWLRGNYKDQGNALGNEHIPWVEEPITLGELLGSDPRCGQCGELHKAHSPQELRECTEKFLADPKNYRPK